MRNFALFSISFSLFFALLMGGCEDPPPPPQQGAFILGIRTVLPSTSSPVLSGGMNENLLGFDGIDVKVSRIDIVHRTILSDASTEQVITIDSTNYQINLVGDLQDQAPRQLGFFNVPVGYIFQLRIIPSEIVIKLRGQSYSVKIPSGFQTGIKIESLDGIPFEIKENERSGARIVLNPFEQMIRNKGQGFIMKPVLQAEKISFDELSIIIFDRIIVRFNDGISYNQIKQLNDQIKATVIDLDKDTNFFLLQLPTTISLENALKYYEEKSEVKYTHPDMAIFPAQIAKKIPCDPNFQIDGPLAQAKAPETWNITTGTRGSGGAIVAVIDSGFDLKNKDLLKNWYINVGEFPPNLFDTNNDGKVTFDPDLKDFDVDGDGVITFVDLDLDPQKNTKFRQFCIQKNLKCDRDGDGIFTPLDMVSGAGKDNPSKWTIFEDGIDNDGTGREDDLIGWNFVKKNNLPQIDKSVGGQSFYHGTAVAGIIGAEGSSDKNANEVCLSDLVAGVNWATRIIPIAIDVSASRTPLQFPSAIRKEATLAREYLGIRYAAKLKADVINASYGLFLLKGRPPSYILDLPSNDPQRLTCSFITSSGLGSKFDKLFPELQGKESLDLGKDLGNTIFVTASHNCPYHLDEAGTFLWPAQLSLPNKLVVGSVNKTNQKSSFSAFGLNTVDLTAPGEGFNILDISNGILKGYAGTSFSAPLVAGTISLMIAKEPTLKGNASEIIKRLLCSSDQGNNVLRTQVAKGRILNIHKSVVAPLTSGEACP